MLTYVKVWMDAKEYGKKPDAALFGKLSGFIIVPKLCSNSHSNVKAKICLLFSNEKWVYTNNAFLTIYWHKFGFHSKK